MCACVFARAGCLLEHASYVRVDPVQSASRGKKKMSGGKSAKLLRVWCASRLKLRSARPYLVDGPTIKPDCPLIPCTRQRGLLGAVSSSCAQQVGEYTPVFQTTIYCNCNAWDIIYIHYYAGGEGTRSESASRRGTTWSGSSPSGSKREAPKSCPTPELLRRSTTPPTSRDRP